MAGNVSEWTSSVYSESTLSFVHDLNPDYQENVKTSDPDVKRRKVIKGGSWKDKVKKLNMTMRDDEDPRYWSDFIGFRCVFPLERILQEKR